MLTIHHVQIAMPNGGEVDARRFYGELLGFTEIAKPAHLRARGGAWFRTGNLELHLGVAQPFVAATKAHVAFACDDLQALRERLSAAGFPTEDDEPLPGFDRFYTSDPFGNRIELLSRHQDGSGQE
jgi:catechol 2,3-dioxygenase-like lactoylglutathione lyase family enzyme